GGGVGGGGGAVDGGGRGFPADRREARPRAGNPGEDVDEVLVRGHLGRADLCRGGLVPVRGDRVRGATGAGDRNGVRTVHVTGQPRLPVGRLPVVAGD